ncbi:hypothetical protein PV08_07307 [Exophiala spinifera]|uniref:C3HC-type domain-containing protein n=1 Tax=Exophiala spinifera TaxID=91928 RepID=A0A0D2B6N8_9EURO|nr:uncharacterized protein PV08_07307 [Exophiala spinifera]KIW14523.1 hypothetical protein PV08_07307 [Exophiala spinifera]
MSYAVETKKRKFDRILEALSDGATSPSRSSLNTRNNTSTTTLTQDSASDSSKRRRVAPTSKVIVTSSSTTSLSGHYLPSSRSAFLQRLETFRHVTQWHIPSSERINAAAWAKRGWTCVDTDTVYCGACKERVHVDLEVDADSSEAKDHEDGEDGTAQDDSFAFGSEVYEGLVKRYQEMIVTAHAESCPWHRRGCDATIQRIEGLLNTKMALSGLQTRYDSLMSRADEIPEHVSLPVENLEDAHILEDFRFTESEKPHCDALKLALCGWERKGDDIIECHHCFRSLGLWLYRGESPAMDRLDAVEDHLEYCPWRSAEAQHTEVVVGGRENTDNPEPKTRHLAGWALVFQAMLKDHNKKRGSRSVGSTFTSEVELSTAGSEVSSTPAQREKKMRDLLRRIKEIKKPFNVKSLLRRKDRAQT